MRHSLMAVVAAALVAACLAVPRARAEYVYLGWDDCNAAGAPTSRTFACDVNTGSDVVVVSFTVPWSGSQWSRADVKLDLMTAQDSSMPDWWAFVNAGTCRQSSLTSACDFTGMTGCAVYMQAPVSGGITSYVQGTLGESWRARLTASVTKAPLSYRVLSPDSQYYAIRIVIPHDKSVGVDACAGCSQPVCLVGTYLGLYLPPNQNPFPFEFSPNNPSVLSWQSTVPNCPAAVPVKRSTWGAVKAMYR
ncbi:MAG: hypothetical protein U0704_15325 [Candidatus Eisenbacteria bacterium]